MAGHLSQAVREMNSALRNARISIMSIRQGLEKKRNNSHIPTKTANYQQLVDDLPSLIFYYFVNDIYAIAGSFFTIFSISDMLFSVTSAICADI